MSPLRRADQHRAYALQHATPADLLTPTTRPCAAQPRSYADFPVECGTLQSFLASRNIAASEVGLIKVRGFAAVPLVASSSRPTRHVPFRTRAADGH